MLWEQGCSLFNIKFYLLKFVIFLFSATTPGNPEFESSVQRRFPRKAEPREDRKKRIRNCLPIYPMKISLTRVADPG